MKKLIRDKIPQLIEDKSRLSQISDPKLVREYVAAKVLEEAQELSEALLSGTEDDILEESADLYETILKTLTISKLTEIQMFRKSLAKDREKGAFDDNWILEV